jgi:hypothetical protein
MRKTITQIAMTLALMMILIPIPIHQRAESTLATEVYMTPTAISQDVGTQFTITVGISNVVDLAGFDVMLSWDPAILTYDSHTKTPETVLNPIVFAVADVVDAAGGTYDLAAATLGGAPFSGSGVIFTVTLNVTAVGYSALTFPTHDLADPIPNPIAHTVVEGVFDNQPTVVEYDLTISVTGMGTTDPAVGTYTYEESTVVPVTATPSSGWEFDHWLLDTVNVGSANPYSVTMDSNHALTAVFTEIPPVQYELTITVTGSGTTTPAVGSHMYDEGTVVPVTAVPAIGWSLDHWLLDSVDAGMTNPYSVTMDSDHALEAVFIEVPPTQYDLTISVTGMGTTDPAPGVHTYDEGTVVPVTATADSGWELDYWLLDTVNVGSANPYSVTMDGNHALEAVFVEAPPSAPTVSSSDDTGAEKNEYDTTEAVYVTGDGFDPDEPLTVYVLLNGDPFTSAASIFSKPVQADAMGVLAPVQLGVFPVGEYDVWIDRNANGVLDAPREPVDAFDMATSGFFVIPEFFAGTILGLLACFAALSMLYVRKRPKKIT